MDIDAHENSHLRAMISANRSRKAQMGIISALTKLQNAYVIQRHLIDGVDIPRIVVEYRERWGEEFAKTERTIKTYQRRALEKIQRFEEKTYTLMKE